MSVSTRTLLWHGSRLSNWVGILSQGLRVAPPEAPVTGYMVGWMYTVYHLPLFVLSKPSALQKSNVTSQK